MDYIKGIPSLQRFKFEQCDGTIWIFFDDFYNSLKDDKQSTDSNSLRRWNLIRSFTEDGSRREEQDSNKLQVPLTKVLTYCIKNSATFTFARNVVSELEQLLTNQNQDDCINCVKKVHNEKANNINNLLKLYKNISRALFLSSELEEAFSDYTICEKDLKTLHDYRHHFSNKEWERIKLFEYHFQTQNQDCIEWDYERLLNEKVTFFETCDQLQKSNKHLLHSCKVLIKHEADRQGVGEALDGILYRGANVHLPSVINNTVLDSLPLYLQDQRNFFCSPCNEKVCKHEKD